MKLPLVKDAMAFCFDLMTADTEDAVISLLQEEGYWEEPSCWRLYGDYENNFNTIGNQQSRPDAALIEKLINSVDARLMHEALRRNIDPAGPEAPGSVQEAVSLFFEQSANPRSDQAGKMKNWTASRRTEVARSITFAATGSTARNGNPCFTIADAGEGQMPRKLPDTILSLHKDNKLRIPFVQGKFNMGGTGVLKFAGRHNLQLVLSRRDPALIPDPPEAETDVHWGFTVVRREDPEGGRRSSVYSYLAPVRKDSGATKGSVLTFAHPTFPLFPDRQEAYSREAAWGTLIKLYEYDATGFRSHMFRRDGFQRRADLLLPDVALPIRFHECRPYSGKEAGSFETTLTGLSVRLADDRGKNLETGFPTSSVIRVQGEEMTAVVYAFNRDRAETYRKNEGVIFVMNGQTHGSLSLDFFRRKKVGLSYLADSILLVVDCSDLSGRAREDLFMNSRDRLSHGELRSQIEAELEDLLANHAGLRSLKEQRRREEIESRLEDSKPLEDMLQKLLKESPSLASFFLKGQRASNPFKSRGSDDDDTQYVGERFPTFFKFKGKDYGHTLHRDCHVNLRSRIPFETDATNDYLDRDEEPGALRVTLLRGDSFVPVDTANVNLHNGIATLSLRLPSDAVPGEELEYVVSVSDGSRVQPFQNQFVLHVLESATVTKGSEGARKPPSGSYGDRRDWPGGIAMPKIIKVRQNEWGSESPPFDQFTALRAVHAGSAETGDQGAEEAAIYDFYVNVDNAYLRTEQKRSSTEANILEARFVYGLVLIGLGVMQVDAETNNVDTSDGTADEDSVEPPSIEDRIGTLSRGVAPVLLPIIESLGDLEIDD